MKIRFCKKCDGQENLSKPGYSDAKCQNCGSEEFYIKEVEDVVVPEWHKKIVLDRINKSKD